MTNITILPSETVAQILTHLDPDREILNIDKRGYVQSEVSLPEPGPPSDASESVRAVGNFRRTCRRFAQDGARHMFQRLVIRFSKAELARLQNIARSPQLAKEVRKLTYMVPRFFHEDRARVEDYLKATDPLNHRPSFRPLIVRANEQLAITDAGIDARVLDEALQMLCCLQHVQLLRQNLNVDDEFLGHVRRHSDTAERLISYEWKPAMSHASKTLVHAMRTSEAMLREDFPLNRLSCHLDLESVANLIADSGQASRSIVKDLECLSMRFDSNMSEVQFQQLGITLRELFELSNSIISMHIGFPARPVPLSLRDVFLGIRLDKLRVLSIDGWRMCGEDVIKIVRQYKHTLRGLRLRGVLLEVENLLWKDVLAVIRRETQLVWISLRRINYAEFWDEMRSRAIEDDDDDDDEDNEDGQSESSIEPTLETDSRRDDDDDGDEEYDDDDDDYDYDSQDEDGQSSEGGDNSVADSNADSDHDVIPPTHGAGRRREPQAWDRQCSCSGDTESIGDDGEYVQKAQWKYWERWVLGRRHCAVHGQRLSR